MNTQLTDNFTPGRPSIAVIGATGKTGSRVIERLAHQKIPARALSRQSTPSFDWNSPLGWAAALDGIHTVFITYFPDLAIPKAADDIRQFIAAAKTAGVKKLVLLSGRGELGAERAETLVQSSGLEWNIVRASWFMQNFSESFMLEGILANRLILPEPKALEPFIDLDDLAEVITKVLTEPNLSGRVFEVTGPELLSFEACTDAIGQALNRPIVLQTIALDEYIAIAEQQPGLPEGFSWLINELFSQVLDGRNEFTTNTVEYVLGRKATCFSEYVQKSLTSGVWNTQLEGAL